MSLSMSRLAQDHVPGAGHSKFFLLKCVSNRKTRAAIFFSIGHSSVQRSFASRMTDVKSSFAPQLLGQESQSKHRESYAASKPYRHAVVDGLINEDLLKKARGEIVEELRFTEKETDIYKVNQTGDLANLDGLPESERHRLEGVLQVRNAIYSKQFRQWLMAVTGCGPLSEKKKDMSINDYTNGCHLLNHE